MQAWRRRRISLLVAKLSNKNGRNIAIKAL
jgi:hypothetical protein